MNAIYTGVIEKILTQNELALYYEGKLDISNDLLLNQYVIIKDENKTPLDKYRMSINGLVKLKNNYSFKSNLLGEIKPKDEIQVCLFDALLNNYNNNNNVVLAKGKAGSGKSLISLHYCFYALDKGIADKITITVNPLNTRNSAKLGFYPGSRDEKLLDSFIGNMLASKLGDKMMVNTLINRGQIELIPVGDIRGFETGKRTIYYLPEAQNMDIDLMKLVLQRVGNETKVIIDGDVDSQVDLKEFEDSNNGMKRVSEVFKGTDIYTEVTLKTIYRSKIASIADKM